MRQEGIAAARSAGSATDTASLSGDSTVTDAAGSSSGDETCSDVARASESSGSNRTRPAAIDALARLEALASPHPAATADHDSGSSAICESGASSGEQGEGACLSENARWHRLHGRL